jgi:hypothetical protein
MLDEHKLSSSSSSDAADDTRLFVNTSTGRVDVGGVRNEDNEAVILCG